ncbi:hypothetical protein BJ138DRAFT_1195350 [Hygrophoropsis aurantiaca]|uniref:Uncharacterized protein n=1 Tax=Hygrophoropsis aurantiaca TaxID=72124 RepID=A0ACB8AP00_9AGAM|nr:hypothetical protein BJ138DRAFT_1195350 [Hygrophoropsis aurantiaca]
MHTRNKPGINFDVAADIDANFTWVPPLASEGDNIDDYLAGLEARTPEDLDEALVALEREIIAVANDSIDGYEALECNVYNFEELAQVEQGPIPKSIEDEISVVDCSGDNGGNTWNIDSSWFVNARAYYLSPGRQKSANCQFCRLCRQNYAQILLPTTLDTGSLFEPMVKQSVLTRAVIRRQCHI